MYINIHIFLRCHSDHLKIIHIQAHKAAEDAAQLLLRELEKEDAAAAEAAAQAKEKLKNKNKNKGKNKAKGSKENEKKEEGQEAEKKGEEEMASISTSSSSTNSSTNSSSVAAVAAALGNVALIPDEEQERKEAEQQKKKMATAAASPPLSTLTEPDEDFLLEGVPENYLCPISLALMTDPVVCMDQQTYNRSDLEEWFATCRRKGQPITSPTTNAPMGEFYILNQSVKGMILEWVQRRKNQWRETGGGKMKG